MPDEDRTELAQVRAALEYAVTVIESYEMDVRTIVVSGDDLALATLADLGYFQGRAYLNARATIRRIAAGETTV